MIPDTSKWALYTIVSIMCKIHGLYHIHVVSGHQRFKASSSHIFSTTKVSQGSSQSEKKNKTIICFPSSTTLKRGKPSIITWMKLMWWRNLHCDQERHKFPE